jgi:predicted transposase/invertase (TIGR01784 family)
VELGKLEGVVEKPAKAMTEAERWGIFFRYLTDKSKRGKINEILEDEEGIAMAGKVLLGISKDEVERARLTSEYKYVVDTQSKVVRAKREGREEGRLEGWQEGRLEVARNLKMMGEPIEKIARVTGVPYEVIKSL